MAGNVRRFDFQTGVETSEVPEAQDPSNDNDIVTKGFADKNYMQGRLAVADIAALKALDVADLEDKHCVFVESKHDIYHYDLESSDTADDDLVVQPTAGAGRYLKVGPIDPLTGNLVVPGDLTVNGTTTTVNSTTLDVVDANITVNEGGNQATANAQGAGVTVEMSDATDAAVSYDSSLTSKFKVGEVGSEVEIQDVSSAQNVSNKTVTDDQQFTSTGAVKIPSGVTGARPGSPLQGHIRYNQTDSQFEGYNGASWGALGGGSATQPIYSLKSVNYTILDDDDIGTIGGDASSGNITITLPTAADNVDRIILVKKLDATTGRVIVDGEGAESIDGATTYELARHLESIEVISDGINWKTRNAYLDRGLVARAYYAATNNLVWSSSSATYAAFPTDAQCPAITVEYERYIVDTTNNLLPEINFSYLPAGDYQVTATFTRSGTTAADIKAFCISDGAAQTGCVAFVHSGSQDNITLEGLFSYTSGAARSFEIYGKTNAGTIQIDVDDSLERLTFTVVKL